MCKGWKCPLRCWRNEKEKDSEHKTLSEIMIWSRFYEISAPSGQDSEKRAENCLRTRKTFFRREHKILGVVNLEREASGKAEVS